MLPMMEEELAASIRNNIQSRSEIKRKKTSARVNPNAKSFLLTNHAQEVWVKQIFPSMELAYNSL